MLRGRRAAGPDRAHRQLPVGRVLLDGTAVGLATGLVGAGGGFLVVPALALLGGLPMPVAVGTSLLVIAMKSAAGFAGYLSTVQIDWTPPDPGRHRVRGRRQPGRDPAGRTRPRTRPLPALRLVRAGHGHLRPDPAGPRPHRRPDPRGPRLAGRRSGRPLRLRRPLPAAPRRPQDLAFPLRPCSGPLRRDAAGTRPCAEPPCRPPEVRTPRCPGAR
ncbi:MULTISPECIES: sulfite exporter TauE/SafE family protein [unclassified Streptomyces]|uniref:sulfite exporter TauE/SafE family protein n=1 Tax=unclassified Streptomyces TaxID=2593676 RepID=UPI00340EF834